ncbi:hypothetical protein C2G38_2117984, partial [Gigaspora rosea]
MTTFCIFNQLLCYMMMLYSVCYIVCLYSVLYQIYSVLYKSTIYLCYTILLA